MAVTELAHGPDAPEDTIRVLRDETSQLIDQTTPRVASVLRMAVEAFDEALLRLGVPLTGESDDT